MTGGKQGSALAGLAVLGLSVLAAGCNSTHQPNTIEYQATGSAYSVNVVYYDVDQQPEHVSIEWLPWSCSFKCDDTRRHLYISADGYTFNSVTVGIYANGKLLAADTGTTGAYADTMWP